jgi:hypothetical protein
VTTHSQIANVIEEDHTGNARWIHGIAKQCPNHDIGPPRLIHNGGAKTVVLAAEALQSLGKRSGPEVRGTAHHQPGGLASGMGIDDPDSMSWTHFLWISALFSKTLVIRRLRLGLLI